MLLSALLWFAPAMVSMPIVASDFRCRHVSVVWLVAVFLVCITVAACTDSPCAALHNLFAGCSVVALLMLGLAVYLGMRHGRMRLGHGFGAGDWCYIAALSPLFSPSDLLKLLVAASMLSIVWFRSLNRGRRSTIPFAGMIGLTLICVVLIRFFMLWII